MVSTVVVPLDELSSGTARVFPASDSLHLSLVVTHHPVRHTCKTATPAKVALLDQILEVSSPPF